MEQAVNEICRSGRNLFLLRFHGHGAPGDAGISTGHGELDPVYEHNSGFDFRNVAKLHPLLMRLKPLFGPYGAIQFMHCNTGKGPNGRALLSTFASIVGVPASAALNTQYGGGGVPTFKFEGPVHTSVPGGMSLKSWCQALPEFSLVCY